MNQRSPINSNMFTDTIGLRPATIEDHEFALHVTEVCMREYAERTWGSWDRRADLDLSIDEVIQHSGTDIGLLGVERHSDHWRIDKLYVLPSHQNRGIGSHLIEGLKQRGGAAGVELRLTVLEVNPARRFYERHGFVLVRAITPRHHMCWNPDA
jgi:GNAT superfamily N-acetyltransferase